MHGTDGRQERNAVSLRSLAGTVCCFDHARSLLLFRPAVCEGQINERSGGGAEEFGVNDNTQRCTLYDMYHGGRFDEP